VRRYRVVPNEQTIRNVRVFSIHKIKILIIYTYDWEYIPYILKYFYFLSVCLRAEILWFKIWMCKTLFVLKIRHRYRHRRRGMKECHFGIFEAKSTRVMMDKRRWRCIVSENYNSSSSFYFVQLSVHCQS